MGGGFSIQAQDSVRTLIYHANSTFSSAEKKVADKIISAPMSMVEANISEAAELCGVSEATVVRFCKHLGYSGFYQMKLQLSHDIGQTQRGATLSPGRDTSSGQKRMLQIAERIQGLARRLSIDSVKRFAEYINGASIIHVIGRGFSKALSSDIIQRLNNYGIRAMGAGEYISEVTDLMLAGEDELLLCVSKSGETRRVIDAAEIARGQGLRVLALTGADKCPLSKIADLTLSVGCFAEDTPDSNVYLLSAMDCVFTYIKPRQDLSDRLERLISDSRM